MEMPCQIEDLQRSWSMVYKFGPIIRLGILVTDFKTYSQLSVGIGQWRALEIGSQNQSVYTFSFPVLLC